MTSLSNLYKYAKTGVTSKDMTSFDKLLAMQLAGDGFPVKTISGVPPIPFDSDGTPLIAWTVVGNEVQTGTPSPQNIVMPQECGDRTSNLFDDNSALIYAATISKPQIEDESVIFPYSTGGNRRCIFIPVNPNTTYTWSCVSSDKLVIAEYNEAYTKQQLDTYTVSNSLSSDRVIYFNLSSGESNYTFTTSGTAKMIGIYYQFNSVAKKIMLNTGSTALPYEPYGYKIPLTLAGQTQTIYLSEPLRKIGNPYDFVASDGTVKRWIKKLVLDGTETWDQGAVNLFVLGVSAQAISNGASAYSTHYLGVSSKSGYSQLYSNQICARSTGTQIWIRDPAIETAEDFKTYLAQQYAAGTPVTVWYVLANPVTETVTVPTLTPAKGSNTLSIGTTLQPSSVSITGGIK